MIQLKRQSCFLSAMILLLFSISGCSLDEKNGEFDVAVSARHQAETISKFDQESFAPESPQTNFSITWNGLHDERTSASSVMEFIVNNNTGDSIESQLAVVVRGLGTRKKIVDLGIQLFEDGDSKSFSLAVSDIPLQTNSGACTATVEIKWVRTTPAGLETVSESSKPVFIRHSSDYKMAFFYSEKGFITQTDKCLNGPRQFCLVPKPGEKDPDSISPDLERSESRIAVLSSQSVGREMDSKGVMQEVTLSSESSQQLTGLIAQWMGQESNSLTAEGGSK